MAVTFVAASTIGAVSANPPTMDITLPALSADDIIIISVASRNIVEASNEINTPSGYTEVGTKYEIDSAVDNAYDLRTALFYKRAVAGDSGATVTISRNGSSTLTLYAVATVWRGAVASGDPFDTTGIAVGGDATAGDVIVFPAFDPTATDVHVICLGWKTNDVTDALANFTNDSTTFTIRDDQETTVGSDGTFGCWSADRNGNALSAKSVDVIGGDGSYIGYTFALLPAGGTTYEQSASGGTTPTGAIIKGAAKVTAGTLTTSATVNKASTKTFSGTQTTSGDLTKTATKTFAGTVTSAGALINTAGKVLSGALTSAGALLNSTGKTLSGTVTSAGEIAKASAKALTGTLTSAGDLIKSTAKAFTGTLTSDGILTSVRTFLKDLGGTLTMAGAAIRETAKTLTGTVTTSGAISKAVNKILSGTVTLAGEINKAVSKTLAGALTLSGAIGKAIGKVVSGVLSFIGALTSEEAEVITGTGNLEVIKAARLQTIYPDSLENIKAARLQTIEAQAIETIKAPRIQNIDR